MPSGPPRACARGMVAIAMKARNRIRMALIVPMCRRATRIPRWSSEGEQCNSQVRRYAGQRLFVLDEAVLAQPQVSVPHQTDSLSVVLVLNHGPVDCRAFLHFKASGERTRRGLAGLGETDDLGPVHGNAGRAFLVVLHFQLRRSRH